MMKISSEHDLMKRAWKFELTIHDSDLMLFKPDKLYRDIERQLSQNGSIADKLFILEYLTRKIEERKKV